MHATKTLGKDARLRHLFTRKVTNELEELASTNDQSAPAATNDRSAPQVRACFLGGPRLE